MELATAYADVQVYDEPRELGTTQEVGAGNPGITPWVTDTTTSATRIIPLSDQPIWLRDALMAIRDLSDLEDGWDSYGAETPNDRAISMARQLVELLGEMDIKPNAVRASAEGGVCISFADADRYGDVECFNSGEMLAVTSSDTEKAHAWEVPASDIDILQAVQRIHEFIG